MVTKKRERKRDRNLERSIWQPRKRAREGEKARYGNQTERERKIDKGKIE